MPENGANENEPTVIKHTHYTPSLAATIMGYLLMPRPPLEEGGELRPPLFDVKTLLMIMGVSMILAVIIVAVASSDRSVITSINLNK